MIWINLAATIAGSGAMLPSLVLLASGIARAGCPDNRAPRVAIAHQRLRRPDLDYRRR
jgi:hypothetical protein